MGRTKSAAPTLFAAACTVRGVDNGSFADFTCAEHKASICHYIATSAPLCTNVTACIYIFERYSFLRAGSLPGAADQLGWPFNQLGWIAITLRAPAGSRRLSQGGGEGGREGGGEGRSRVIIVEPTITFSQKHGEGNREKGLHCSACTLCQVGQVFPQIRKTGIGR